MSSMLVGYFSYDVIRYMEKIPDRCKDDLKIPDIRLSRPKNLVIYDNVKKKIFYIENVYSDTKIKNYKDIELSHLYVDNAAMQLARDPNQFDVLFTEYMFGDILSDEMGVICGSLGMLASASLGASKNSLELPFGLYEPSGGTAPDIAGQGIANPCAQILSGAMMLRYSFGENDADMSMEEKMFMRFQKDISDVCLD